MHMNRRLPIVVLLGGSLFVGGARWHEARRPAAGQGVSRSSRLSPKNVTSAARRAPHEARESPATSQPMDPAHRLLLSEVIACIEQQSDFTSAVEVIEERISGPARDECELEITRALADLNPDWAATFAFSLSENSAKCAAVDVAAGAIARRSSRDALAWVQTLPAGFPRGVAIERIVGQLLADAGLPAAAKTLTALPSSLVQDDALCSLAAHWIRQDRSNALEWVNHFPDTPLKPRLIATVGFELASADPAETQWLATNFLTSADRALFLASVRWGREAKIMPNKTTGLSP